MAFVFCPACQTSQRDGRELKVAIGSSWREHLLHTAFLKPFSSDTRTGITCHSASSDRLYLHQQIRLGKPGDDDHRRRGRMR
jgi:hypothetical protein